MNTDRLVRFAPVLAAAASAGATWWLIGDLTPSLFSPDYLYETPTWVKNTEDVWGPVALLVWTIAVSVLVRLRLKGPLPVRSGWRAGILTISGLAIGAGLRVITAGGSGANIGGGGLVLLGPWLVGYLWLAAWRIGTTSELVSRVPGPSPPSTRSHRRTPRPPAPPSRRTKSE